jgi:hypothetical protein
MDHSLRNGSAPILTLHDVTNFVDAVLVHGVNVNGDLSPRGPQLNVDISRETDLTEQAAYPGLEGPPVGWQWVVNANDLAVR